MLCQIRCVGVTEAAKRWHLAKCKRVPIPGICASSNSGATRTVQLAQDRLGDLADLRCRTFGVERNLGIETAWAWTSNIRASDRWLSHGGGLSREGRALPLGPAGPGCPASTGKLASVRLLGKTGRA
jgi:hypothetical protein